MSQFSASPYDVQKTSGVCVVTGQELAPGEECYSALVDIPPDHREKNDQLGMRRVDISLASWEQGHRPPHLFSFWKTTIPEPSSKKKTYVDDAVLMNLLRRLEDAEEPQRLAFRYVVALILMRKKLLRFDGTQRCDDPADDGPVQEWWVFTPKRDVAKGHFGKWADDETLTVLDPNLDASQIEQVTAQLDQVLDGSF